MKKKIKFNLFPFRFDHFEERYRKYSANEEIMKFTIGFTLIQLVSTITIFSKSSDGTEIGNTSQEPVEARGFETISEAREMKSKKKAKGTGKGKKCKKGAQVSQYQGHCYHCGVWGHRAFECPSIVAWE